MEMSTNSANMKIKITDDILKGVYANQISVMHTKDDFVLDFISMYPPEGIISARVITNPSAFKRMVMAMMDNINKYEEKFGEIPSPEMQNGVGTPINSKIN